MNLSFIFILVLRAGIFVSGFLSLAVFVRILLSWFRPGGIRAFSGVFFRFLSDVTDPVLNLAKRFPHRYGMMDFSALIAMFALDFLRYFLRLILSSLF